MLKFSIISSLLLAIGAFNTHAHGALIQHFNEVGGDVVVSFTGAVDLGASFSSDGGSSSERGFRPRLGNFGIVASLVSSPGSGGYVEETYSGSDLLAAPFSDAGRIDGTLNSSGIAIFNSSVKLNHNWFSVLNNDVGDVSMLDASGNLSGRTFAFSGHDFDSLGIDQWEGLGPQDLWGVTATPASSQLIQFQVGAAPSSGPTVPEPSSCLLMLIGAAGLGVRRRLWAKK